MCYTTLSHPCTISTAAATRSIRQEPANQFQALHALSCTDMYHCSFTTCNQASLQCHYNAGAGHAQSFHGSSAHSMHCVTRSGTHTMTMQLQNDRCTHACTNNVQRQLHRSCTALYPCPHTTPQAPASTYGLLLTMTATAAGGIRHNAGKEPHLQLSATPLKSHRCMCKTCSSQICI